MADEKKPGPPAPSAPPPAPPKKDAFVELVTIIGGFLLALMAINALLSGITHSRVFSHGLSGLTPHGILLSHTRSIASLDHAIGVRVVSISDSTDVYDSPGEKKIGKQPFGIRGKILQGPVTIGNDTYWYVDFDTGTDGWVNEKDIAYLESEPGPFERAIIYLFSAFSVLKVVSVLASIAFLVFMGFVIVRLTKIRRNEQSLLYPVTPISDVVEVNPKWDRVMNHVESGNKGDWRLAILEADIMLDELLEKLSLPGETIGDKLKLIEPSDFITLNNAWEAHKVRNQIAHEGGDFLITNREARRVIELYRTVFEEFDII